LATWQEPAFSDWDAVSYRFEATTPAITTEDTLHRVTFSIDTGVTGSTGGFSVSPESEYYNDLLSDVRTALQGLGFTDMTPVVRTRTAVAQYL
jgi:hypothetical protein